MKWSRFLLSIRALMREQSFRSRKDRFNELSIAQGGGGHKGPYGVVITGSSRWVPLNGKIVWMRVRRAACVTPVHLHSCRDFIFTQQMLFAKERHASARRSTPPDRTPSDMCSGSGSTLPSSGRTQRKTPELRNPLQLLSGEATFWMKGNLTLKLMLLRQTLFTPFRSCFVHVCVHV